MALFEARLLKDHKGTLVPYGDILTIDTDSSSHSIERAKTWAKDQLLLDDTWLQVTFNGVECAMMKAGDF